MYLDTRTNTLVVGTTNVGPVREALVGMIGSGAPLEVHLAAGDGGFDSRYEPHGKMEAGDAILTETPNHECTAGPGAWKSSGPNQPKTKFLLTAGHCGGVGQTEYRMAARESTKGVVPFGHVAANALPRTGGYEEDGAAIAFDNGNIAPSQIFRPNVAPLDVGPAGTSEMTPRSASRE